MTVSPNLKVQKDWRGTLNLAFSVLRRIAFLTPEDFSFGTFDPQTDFAGMAVTNYRVYRTRYLKIFNFLWFSVDMSATLAAPLTNVVYVTIPATASLDNATVVGTSGQAVGAAIGNAGGLETGTAQISNGSNRLQFLRATVNNYTAGSASFRANGFLEVI